MEQTCRHLANSPQIELMTMSQYVTTHPPTHRVQLLEGSWGTGGDHFLVNNPETHGLWTRLHAAEDRIEQIATQELSDNQQDLLNQAVRQLLLLQSSDWATMITSRQADTFARQQFNVHYERFEQLMTILETGQINNLQGKDHWESRKSIPILSEIDVS